MIEAFPDRRNWLFGRMADIHHLTERARQPGLTAVVARPLMGKTWTLTEVARLLLEEDRFLVGYHESKAAESSHLLYAVSNLYVRWLADSSMRAQAISLWERHKDNLVPRIGQMMGLLFEKLAKNQLPEGVAALVRAAFDGLAEAQKDLLSGGLQLAPLPYDQALSLTELVAKVSQRRIVLILDAWEKSPSLRSELTTLESYLKHPEQWPHTHILLGARNPERDAAKGDEAYQQIGQLCEINGARKDQLYELAPINQKDPRERDRLLRFIRETVPAAQDQSEQALLDLIDGFPGVLYFWTNEANHGSIRTLEDLRQKARDAWVFRYADLEHALSRLQDDASQKLAARVAFFPRLDGETWTIFRDLLLNDHPETAVDGLVDANVLNDERFPTYGHDTRHAAARQWFIKHRRPLIRRVSEYLIIDLASRVTGVNSASRPFFEALVGCFETAGQVDTSPELRCLTDAARCVFGDAQAFSHNEFEALYPKAIQRNASVVALIAISLLARGVARGDKGDSNGAIADYTSTIALPDAPAEQVAEALINRGITKSQQRKFDEAIADYSAAIVLPTAPPVLVARALVYRGTEKSLQNDANGAIADFSATIALPQAPIEQVAPALVYRGITKSYQGDFDGAIADFSAAIVLHDAPTTQVAKALVGRAVAKNQKGDFDGIIADFSAAIVLPDAPTEQVAQALIGRGIAKNQLGDFDGAIADFSATIVLSDAPTEQVAQALVGRGIAKDQQGDLDGEIADYSAVLMLSNAPADQVAKALVNRGITKSQQGDFDGAITDCSAVIMLPDAPIVQVAKALVYRGGMKSQQCDFDGAIADYTAIITLPGAPAERMAEAVLSRGIIKAQQGDFDGAIADYTAIITLPGASAKLRAQAVLSRGVAKRQQGNFDGAIADYTAVTTLPGAPAEQMAQAALSRGIIKGQQGDLDGAIADYTVVITLSGAPAGQKLKALVYRGLTKGKWGDSDGAIADFTAVITLPGAPAELVAVAFLNRGITKGQQGDAKWEIADYTAVITLPDAPVDVIEEARRNLADLEKRL